MGLESELKSLDAQQAGLHAVTEEELKGIHSVLLTMLDHVKSICDAHQISWGICGGCALGAIRHHGFIPWDDDVDIFMTRKDFGRFRRAFAQDKPKDYELLCPGEEGYYGHMPKIFNNATTIELIQNLGRGKGLFIDIFILDNVYENKLMRTIHGLFCTGYLFIISCVVTRTQRNLFYRYGSQRLKKKVRLRSFFGALFSFRKPEAWIRSAVKCFSKVKNDKTKQVVSITGSGHYFGELYDRNKICKFREMPFEDRCYPIIEEIDYFCQMRFGGDYMTIPPVEKQEKHAYISLDLTK